MKNFARLLVALFVLLSAVSCEKSSQAKGKAKGTDLLTYSPKNSNVLFYANISNLKTADILKGEIDKYQTETHKKFDEKLNEFIRLTGFDPAKDVDEVMVSGNGFDNDDSFIFTAKGNFPSSELIAYIEKKKEEDGKDDVDIIKSEYNGHVLYQFKGIKTHRMKYYDKEVSSKETDAFVAFIDNKVMIAGKEKAVKKSLDGKSSVKENASFLAKVKEVAHNDAYSVIDTEQFKEKINVPKEFKHNIEMIKNVSFGMSADKELSFSFVGECLTAMDAQNLRDAVQGIVALARIGVSAERDLIDFMNEVEVVNDDTKVSLNIEITKERLEKLKAYKDKLPRAEI